MRNLRPRYIAYGGRVCKRGLWRGERWGAPVHSRYKQPRAKGGQSVLCVISFITIIITTIDIIIVDSKSECASATPTGKSCAQLARHVNDRGDMNPYCVHRVHHHPSRYMTVLGDMDHLFWLTLVGPHGWTDEMMAMASATTWQVIGGLVARQVLPFKRFPYLLIVLRHPSMDKRLQICRALYR